MGHGVSDEGEGHHISRQSKSHDHISMREISKLGFMI